MRIAYFQMDKHSSIALQDLHIFPTKNQIIVTLLFGPNFVILDLADLFLSFQLLLPPSGGPVSHKPVTLVPSRSIPRSRLPQLDAIQGAHIFKGAEELGLGGNQLPVPSWRKKRTHLKDGKFGKLLLGEWDGFLLFTTFNFWLLASNLTNCRHEGYEVSTGCYCEYWPSDPRHILPMFCQSI